MARPTPARRGPALVVVAGLLALAALAAGVLYGGSGADPAEASAPAGGLAKTTRTTGEDVAEPPAEPPSAKDHRDERLAVFADAAEAMLDELEAEAGLTEEQRTSLSAVLETERTSGVTTLSRLRPGPDGPPLRPDEVKTRMEAHRTQAEEAARALLSDDQYAAWATKRAPRALRAADDP